MSGKIPATFFSCGAMIAIGGYAGWWVGGHSDSAGAKPSPQAQGDQVTLSKNPSALLDEFILRSNEGRGAAGKSGGAALARFEFLAKSMSMSDDPEKDFRVRFQECLDHPEQGQKGVEQLAMLGVLLEQWMEVDLSSALLFLDKESRKRGLHRTVYNTFVGRISEKYIDRHGMKAFVQNLPTLGWLENTAPAIFRDIAKRGSLQDLLWLQKTSPMQFGSPDALIEFGLKMSITQRDELLAMDISPLHKGTIIGGLIQQMKGDRGGEWLLSALRDGTITPEMRMGLRNGHWGTHFANMKGVSVDQRIEIMRELGGLPMGEDRTKNEIIFASIRQTFDFRNDTQDLLYRFRHGALDAGDVLENAAPGFPEMGKHTGEFRSQLFRTLAEENIPAAMKMLENLPPKDREREKALAARWWFRESSPADFYQMLTSVNTTGDEWAQSLLRDAWNDKSYGYLHAYGGAYVDWIKGLPDGEAKTNALNSVKNAGGRFSRWSREADQILKSSR